MRTEEMAEKFHNQAKEILEANHLSETPASGGSHRRKQRRLDDYVVESTTGTRNYVSAEDEIRNHTYFTHALTEWRVSWRGDFVVLLQS